MPTDTSLRNPITLERSVTIPAPPARVYEFLTTAVPDHYRALARGHERFEIVGGGSLVEGAVVDCRERAGNQEVHHRYVVRELVRDRRVHYASTPSTTFVHLDGRTLEGRSDTFVTYELAPIEAGTRVDMQIVICFASRWQRFVARALGRTAKLWGAHQAEELDGLAAAVTGASA